jgi:hypothetical protein
LCVCKFNKLSANLSKDLQPKKPHSFAAQKIPLQQVHRCALVENSGGRVAKVFAKIPGGGGGWRDKAIRKK